MIRPFNRGPPQTGISPDRCRPSGKSDAPTRETVDRRTAGNASAPRRSAIRAYASAHLAAIAAVETAHGIDPVDRSPAVNNRTPVRFQERAQASEWVPPQRQSHAPARETKLAEFTANTVRPSERTRPAAPAADGKPPQRPGVGACPDRRATAPASCARSVAGGVGGRAPDRWP